MAMKPVVVGVVVLGVAVGVFYTVSLLGNTGTKVTLAGNPCALSKELEIRVKHKKKVTWEIDNQCDSAQKVTIGNFRLAATGGPNDCSVEGSDWPFREEDDRPLASRERTVNPGEKKKIKQRTAHNETSAPVSYYYDVCLGGTKVDPRLVVDP